MKAFYETRNDPFFVGYMTSYPFPLHVHEIVELVVVLNGSCTVQIDGRPYILLAGDGAIAFPLTPHSYEAIEPGSRGLAAFFPADMFGECAQTFHTQLPDEPVLRGVTSRGEARYVIERLLETPADVASPIRLAYLHVLVAHVLEGLCFHPAADCRERGLGARIVRYVYDHACESITISSAAKDLGISESHLSHLFAQQFQVNFRRFINAIRIDRATMMMRDPYMTLTQVCDSCGFENMRTFRRAFVRETGMLPTAYLKGTRQGEPEEESEPIE